MSRFVGYFESKLAKEIGRLTGWRVKIWARRYDDTPVSNEEAAQVGRLEYILSHGVKEGLVPRPSEWPGAHSVDALVDGTPLEGVWHDRTAEYAARIRGKSFRPSDFAHAETVELSPLPCWEGKSPEALRERHRERVAAIVAEARNDKTRYRKLLRGIRPTDRPQNPKRSPAPWFHCASRSVRYELKRAYAEFLATYRQAAEPWREGELTAPFPERCFPPPRPYITAA